MVRIFVRARGAPSTLFFLVISPLLRYTQPVKYTTPATLALAALILSSCGSSLESESGLYDVELKHSIKVPIDGWWSWGKGPVFRDKKSGYVYIAPLDISLVQEDEPELSALLVPQMHDYMIAYLTRVLDEANKANHTRWKITTDPSKADFRMNMAVVSLRPQRPVLRWIFFVGSFFSPIPGTGTIAGKFTNGDICIEFTIRNNRTGELLYAMKDSNRATTRLYKAEAYHSEGQADKNLQIWAQKIARLVRFYTSDKYSNQDISDLVNNTSVVRALFYRIETGVEDETMASQNAPEIDGPTQADGAKSAANGKNSEKAKSPKGSRAESKPSAEKEGERSSASSQNAPEIDGPTKPTDDKADGSASSQNAPEIEGPTTKAAEAEASTSSKPRRSRRARPCESSESSEHKATDSSESSAKAADPEPAKPAESADKPASEAKPEAEAKPEPEAKPAAPTPPEAPAASAAPEPAKPAESSDSAAKQA